jgi:5-methylcytosine-specific restriction endonuclease McrA
MAFTPDQLAAVFTRTSGLCHLCRGTLALANYGKNGRRGAWEVDHSVPRAKGGTDRLNNLAPACIGCNRSKRDGSTRRVRQANGFTRKPMSPDEKDNVRGRNGLIGLGAGAFSGLLVGGPLGAFIGALVGAGLGALPEPGP